MRCVSTPFTRNEGSAGESPCLERGSPVGAADRRPQRPGAPQGSPAGGCMLTAKASARSATWVIAAAPRTCAQRRRGRFEDARSLQYQSSGSHDRPGRYCQSSQRCFSCNEPPIPCCFCSQFCSSCLPAQRATRPPAPPPQRPPCRLRRPPLARLRRLRRRSQPRLRQFRRRSPPDRSIHAQASHAPS